MVYRATKCPCGDRICKAWHVGYVADVQGVRFTEEQARAVADLLNRMEDGAAGAQYEALMAAKNVLVRLCGAASPEDWSEAIRVLAQCRAAGIPKEDK